MSNRNSTWWRTFWEQALSGGDTMVSVRVFDIELHEMIAAFEDAERRAEHEHHVTRSCREVVSVHDSALGRDGLD